MYMAHLFLKVERDTRALCSPVWHIDLFMYATVAPLTVSDSYLGLQEWNLSLVVESAASLRPKQNSFFYWFLTSHVSQKGLKSWLISCEIQDL